MNKSVFVLINVVCVVGMIAWRVLAGPQLTGLAWTYFGLNLTWGNVGILIAFAITFPILRRIDLLWKLLALGSLVLLTLGGVLATGYEGLQALGHPPEVLTPSDFPMLSRTPHTALVSAVWRFDVQARGRYIQTRHTDSEVDSCVTESVGFCREPVVGANWQPSDPVYLLARGCDSVGQAEPREDFYVRLYPYDDAGSIGWLDFDGRDSDRTHGTRGACAFVREDTRPDLSGAPFHFDPHTGFFVVKLERRNPTGALIMTALFVLVTLAWIFRKDFRTSRIERLSDRYDAIARG